MNLKPSQSSALEFVRRYATSRRDQAQQRIAHILEMSNISQNDYNQALSSIFDYGRIAIHFHPDRLTPDSLTVAESILSSASYKSQFETFLSSGKLSPNMGGPRDRWENRMFGDSYVGLDVSVSDRPKYGAFNLMLLPDGPCPRFGSCHFILSPRILKRCTFTYLDSYLEPKERGTIDNFEDIISSLLADSFEREFVLGENEIRPGKLIKHLKDNLKNPFEDPSSKPAARNLDFYIEAQIHGDINLSTDVDILVYDPSFIGTETGENLKKICERFDIDSYSHCGFSMKSENFPDNFRGPKMPSLATRVASSGIINAKLIGDAAAELASKAEIWSDRGTSEEILQELKLLWHVLVKYGARMT